MPVFIHKTVTNFIKLINPTVFARLKTISYHSQTHFEYGVLHIAPLSDVYILFLMYNTFTNVWILFPLGIYEPYLKEHSILEHNIKECISLFRHKQWGINTHTSLKVLLEL